MDGSRDVGERILCDDLRSNRCFEKLAGHADPTPQRVLSEPLNGLQVHTEVIGVRGQHIAEQSIRPEVAKQTTTGLVVDVPRRLLHVLPAFDVGVNKVDQLRV
ncbi:hypothetical protein AYO47_03930 [Planctomyces sp. SCGC AG-212-M04]|nr:hypothetical protein AYO47_03930 [Planctomyces sp. SCGC AG-212-M04]